MFSDATKFKDTQALTKEKSPSKFIFLNLKIFNLIFLKHAAAHQTVVPFLITKSLKYFNYLNYLIVGTEKLS